ncbi:dimethylaniline monooxygenase 2 [Trichonephila clavipes]|nr:dimethylaniline monooxygenase 2 [Trichonephila clavipes]
MFYCTILVHSRGCGSPVAKVSDHGSYVMSSSPVPLKTRHVYLSTRSGAHILSRLGDRGLPYDHDSSLNDHIGSKLMSRSVIMKPNIKCFTEDGVIFEGDSEVTQVDSVIMATGYTWAFSFLEEGILEQENGRINLYKCMYPPELPHGTLGFIGFIIPVGPGFPTGEIQCRWAVQVLAGKCKLPSKAKMYADIKKRFETNIKRYKPNEKMSIRVDYVPYCDDIASQVGAKPNFLKLFFTDLPLFTKLILGPMLYY